MAIIELQNLDPTRTRFTEESAAVFAEYAAQYPTDLMQELLVTLLLCAYDQGVRDCAEGIVTVEQIDAEHDAEITEITGMKES